MQSATAPSTGPQRVPGSQIDALEARLERANLIIQTLLLLLLEKKVIHEDEFKEWMVYVDELDGQRDGKVKEEVAPFDCPECGRKNPHQAAKCIYCGHAFEIDFLARRPPAPSDPSVPEPPPPPAE
jgi:hypothetical protein